MANEEKKFTPEELATLLALPEDALTDTWEAAAIVRLKYTTLTWLRCHGGGPAFVRVGPKLIRYRMGDLREYMQSKERGDGMRRSVTAMLAARGITTVPKIGGDK